MDRPVRRQSLQETFFSDDESEESGDEHVTHQDRGGVDVAHEKALYQEDVYRAQTTGSPATSSRGSQSGSEVDPLQERDAELSWENQQLREQIEILNGDRQKLLQELEELQDEMSAKDERHQEKLLALNDQIDELERGEGNNSNLAGERDVRVRLETENEDLHDQVRQLSDQVDDLTAQVEENEQSWSHEQQRRNTWWDSERLRLREELHGKLQDMEVDEANRVARLNEQSETIVEEKNYMEVLYKRLEKEHASVKEEVEAERLDRQPANDELNDALMRLQADRSELTRLLSSLVDEQAKAEEHLQAELRNEYAAMEKAQAAEMKDLEAKVESQVLQGFEQKLADLQDQHAKDRDAWKLEINQEEQERLKSTLEIRRETDKLLEAETVRAQERIRSMENELMAERKNIRAMHSEANVLSVWTSASRDRPVVSNDVESPDSKAALNRMNEELSSVQAERQWLVEEYAEQKAALQQMAAGGTPPAAMAPRQQLSPNLGFVQTDAAPSGVSDGKVSVASPQQVQWPNVPLSQRSSFQSLPKAWPGGRREDQNGVPMGFEQVWASSPPTSQQWLAGQQQQESAFAHWPGSAQGNPSSPSCSPAPAWRVGQSPLANGTPPGGVCDLNGNSAKPSQPLRFSMSDGDSDLEDSSLDKRRALQSRSDEAAERQTDWWQPEPGLRLHDNLRLCRGHRRGPGGPFSDSQSEALTPPTPPRSFTPPTPQPGRQTLDFPPYDGSNDANVPAASQLPPWEGDRVGSLKAHGVGSLKAQIKDLQARTSADLSNGQDHSRNLSSSQAEQASVDSKHPQETDPKSLTEKKQQLAESSAKLVDVLQKQVQTLQQRSREPFAPASSDSLVSAIRVLQQQTQRLESTNNEWTSLVAGNIRDPGANPNPRQTSPVSLEEARKDPADVIEDSFWGSASTKCSSENWPVSVASNVQKTAMRLGELKSRLQRICAAK
eukprot:gnl/MRDRNA2_/MRDRNA2_29044_c0_seq1.p1 gnl/MRDRNA2_/MRDRNA2_29044_c0~~gnl/MRDRNA2_/MRDRNA2_29044_c0_seq1.p1  ORF type:complete len:954 (-),score=252.90 gnl/MRDRNA2_/MRDRNA2_29044_c0_seq1:64-2925(-)